MHAQSENLTSQRTEEAEINEVPTQQAMMQDVYTE